MPTPNNILELRNLACLKGERVLFSGVSFEIAAGTLVRVVGANGSGKTSLMRMIAGISQPAAGEVKWNGQTTPHDPFQFLQSLVYLGHASAIKDELFPAENVMASSAIQGENFTQSEVHAVLSQLGLGERLDVESLSLSAGQRRRVALARLWLTQRPLWLLDEPFTALDPNAVQMLSHRISGHLKAGGMCFYTTHQPVEIIAEQSLEISLDLFRRTSRPPIQHAHGVESHA
jgi:heme exporter protein A